jgi:hypothetical protein
LGSAIQSRFPCQVSKELSFSSIGGIQGNPGCDEGSWNLVIYPFFMAHNAHLIVARVVLGFCEIDGGSMYAAQTFISSDGIVVLHRRKLKVRRIC